MRRNSFSILAISLIVSLIFLPFAGVYNVAYGTDADTVSTAADAVSTASLTIGSEGDDTLKGDSSNNIIYGLAGNDLIIGGQGDDTLKGGDDVDDIYGGHGEDTILGGDGDDIIHGGHDIDTIDGGNGVDEIYGGPGDDDLSGSDGGDYIKGCKGDDIIDGGDDNDVLEGSKGDDELYGGDGDDTLHGGPDNDELYGEDGDDVLYGGQGTDLLDGGEGYDTTQLSGSFSKYDIVISGDAENTIFTLTETGSSGGGSSHDGGDTGGHDESGSDKGSDHDSSSGHDESGSDKGSDHDSSSGHDESGSDKGSDHDSSSGHDESGSDKGSDHDSSDSTDAPDDHKKKDDTPAVKTIVNVEYIDFHKGSDDNDIVDVTFVPLDGSVDKIVRNPNGSYTVDWGYSNSNNFTAYEDVHYFEDKSAVILDPESKEFEVGSNSNAFKTSSSWLVQTWQLGDKTIVADGTRLELDFQKYLSEIGAQGRAKARMEMLKLWKEIEEEINKLFNTEEKSDHPAKDSVIRLAKRGLLTDYEAVVKNIDNDMTVAEAVQLLNAVLEYDITESLELDFEEDDMLSPEVMVELFTAVFELDEEEITELNLEVTEEITKGDFYIILAKYL